MSNLVGVLLALAVLAFLSGVFARFLGGGGLLGFEAVVFWRGAIGFLAFAAILLLMQIRDRLDR